MTFPELKPCPFCGGEVKYLKNTYEGEDYFGIICRTYGCVMEIGINWGCLTDDIESLADMWNRRVKK